MKKYCPGLLLLLLWWGCQPSDLDGIIHETIYLRHDGADLPAYVHGNAAERTFILVLHGAGSYGLAFRDGAFTEELEQRYVVVYHDQRGQSMSQGHYAQPEDVVSQMAQDVVALVAALRERYGEDIQLFLLGHSWGGTLGSKVLVEVFQQSLFRGWINVAGVHDFPLAGQARRSLLLNLAQEQIAEGNLVSEWETLQAEVAALDSAATADYRPLLVQARQAMRLLQQAEVVPSSVSGEKLRQALLANNPITWWVSDRFNRPFEEARDMDYSLSEEIARIFIPSLLIWGAYDVSVPPAVGRDALARLGSPDKELLIFDHSIHHPHDTEPERFTEVVVSFVEAHR